MYVAVDREAGSNANPGGMPLFTPPQTPGHHVNGTANSVPGVPVPSIKRDSNASESSNTVAGVKRESQASESPKRAVGRKEGASLQLLLLTAAWLRRLQCLPNRRSQVHLREAVDHGVCDFCNVLSWIEYSLARRWKAGIPSMAVTRRHLTQ